MIGTINNAIFLDYAPFIIKIGIAFSSRGVYHRRAVTMRNGDGVRRPKPPVNGVARRRKLGAGVVRGDGGVWNRCRGALEKVPPDFLRMMKSPAGNGSPHRAVGLIRTVLGFLPGGDADRGDRAEEQRSRPRGLQTPLGPPGALRSPSSRVRAAL